MGHRAELPVLKRIAFSFSTKPKVGEKMWWRGMLMDITEVNTSRLIFKYGNEEFKCASSILEAKFNAQLGLWYLPGAEGEMPQIVRGEIVYPSKPTCKKCGTVTYRQRFCTDCQIIENSKGKKG